MPRRPLHPDEPFSKALIFQSQWEESYGEKYIWSPREKGMWKHLQIDNDELVRRVKIFLKVSWYGENGRHSFASFVNNISKFIPERGHQDKPKFAYECPLCRTEHQPNENCPPPIVMEKIVDLTKILATPKDVTEKEKHNARFPERMIRK